MSDFERTICFFCGRKHHLFSKAREICEKKEENFNLGVLAIVESEEKEKQK